MSAVMKAKPEVESRRCLADKRMAHMKADRARVEAQWKELRDAFMPSRGRFVVTEDDQSKRIALLNETPLFAARTLASGLHAGLTNPARPWQRSSLRGEDFADQGPIKEWLEECDRRMMAWYSKSNLYQALPFMYAEYGVFGTMCGLLLEDDDTLYRVEPYTVGQYYLARNEKGHYDTLAREFQMTVRQAVERFGLDKLSPQTQAKWAVPGQRELKIDIFHIVEPDGNGCWESVYFETSSKDAPPLKRACFTSNPIMAASWEFVGLEPYACSCPGMISRGAAKALQRDELGKSQAIERAHNPPMQGPVKAAGIKLTPGAYNEVDSNMASGQNGRIRSVYDFRPDIAGLLDNINKRERRINQSFYVDLFLMLTMDDRNERATAEEIRAKYDEKVLALGPTLEQANQMLRVHYEFVFNLMVRKSMPIWRGLIDGDPLLPEPPEGLLNQDIQPEFISALQQAQRAQALQGIERVAAFAGNMAQFLGKPPEKFDPDQAIDEYAAGVGVSARLVRDDDEAAQIRANQAQAEQMQRMAMMAPALKDAAGAVKAAGETVPQDGSVLRSLAEAGGGLLG